MVLSCEVFAIIKAKLKELGHLTPLALVSTFLPIVGSSLLIVFIVPIGHWLRDNWQVGIGVFLLGMLFFCGLALLPTNVIGLVAGWSFGLELGILVLITGVVGAASVSFAIYSRISGDKLPQALAKYPRSSAIYRALMTEDVRRTTLIVTLLRLSVVTPFAFTNFLLAASRVPFWAFAIGTTIGMLPRSAAMAFIGSGLAELDLTNARDTYLFALGAVASVIAMIAIAVISRRALMRMTKNQGSANV